MPSSSSSTVYLEEHFYFDPFNLSNSGTVPQVDNSSGGNDPDIADYTSLIRAPGYNDEGLFFSLTLGGGLLIIFFVLMTYLISTRVLWIRRLYRPNHTIPPSLSAPAPLRRKKRKGEKRNANGKMEDEDQKRGGGGSLANIGGAMVVQTVKMKYPKTIPKKSTKQEKEDVEGQDRKKTRNKKDGKKWDENSRSSPCPCRTSSSADSGDGGVITTSSSNPPPRRPTSPLLLPEEEEGGGGGELHMLVDPEHPYHHSSNHSSGSKQRRRSLFPGCIDEEVVDVVIVEGEEKEYVVSCPPPRQDDHEVATETKEKEDEVEMVVKKKEEEVHEDEESTPKPKHLIRRKRVGVILPYRSAFFQLPTWDDWWSVEEKDALPYLQPLLPSSPYEGKENGNLHPSSHADHGSASRCCYRRPGVEEPSDSSGLEKRLPPDHVDLTPTPAIFSCTSSASPSPPAPPPLLPRLPVNPQVSLFLFTLKYFTVLLLGGIILCTMWICLFSSLGDQVGIHTIAQNAQFCHRFDDFPDRCRQMSPKCMYIYQNRTTTTTSSSANTSSSKSSTTNSTTSQSEDKDGSHTFTFTSTRSRASGNHRGSFSRPFLSSTLPFPLERNSLHENDRTNYPHPHRGGGGRGRHVSSSLPPLALDEGSTSTTTTTTTTSSSPSSLFYVSSGFSENTMEFMTGVVRITAGEEEEGGVEEDNNHTDKDECISVEIPGLSQLSVQNIAPASTLWWGVSLCNLGFALFFIIMTVFFVKKVDHFVDGVMRLQLTHAVGYRVACVRGFHLEESSFSLEEFRKKYLTEETYFRTLKHSHGAIGVVVEEEERKRTKEEEVVVGRIKKKEKNTKIVPIYLSDADGGLPPPSFPSGSEAEQRSPRGSREGKEEEEEEGKDMPCFSPRFMSPNASLRSLPPNDQEKEKTISPTPTENEEGASVTTSTVSVENRQRRGENEPEEEEERRRKEEVVVVVKEEGEDEEEDKGEEEMVLNHSPPFLRADTLLALFRPESYRTYRRDATFLLPGKVVELSLMRSPPPGMRQAVKRAEKAKSSFQEAVAHQKALQRRYLLHHPPVSSSPTPTAATTTTPSCTASPRRRRDGVHHAVVKGEEEGEWGLAETTPILKCFAPISSGFRRIPAVPFYEEKYRKAAEVLNALLLKVPEQRSIGSVVILFAEARSAFEFIHLFNCCKASWLRGSYAVIAGSPSDLIHDNLLRSRWMYYFRILLFSALFVVLVFCWSIPVGLLSSLNNLAAIPGLGPSFYEAYLTYVSPAVQNILTAYLPVIVLALFDAFLPGIITWMVSSMGWSSQRECHSMRLYLQYLFMVLTGVIFQMALQGGLRQLSTMVLGGVDTNTVSHFFAACITPQGGYWYAKVIMAFALSTWLDLVDLRSLLPLIRSRGTAYVQRRYNALFEPCRFFDYAQLYSGELTMLAVGLLFHMTVPLLSLFVAIYFLLRYYAMRQRLYERYRPSNYRPLEDCTDFGVTAQVLRLVVSLFALSEFCAIWLLRIRKHQGGLILCGLTFTMGSLLWLWVFIHSQRWIVSLQNARRFFPNPMGERRNGGEETLFPPPPRPLPQETTTAATAIAEVEVARCSPGTLHYAEEYSARVHKGGERERDEDEDHVMRYSNVGASTSHRSPSPVCPPPLSPSSPSSTVHPFEGPLLPTQQSLLAAFHPQHQQLASIDVDADVQAIKESEHTVERYWSYSISWFEGDLVEEEEENEGTASSSPDKEK